MTKTIRPIPDKIHVEGKIQLGVELNLIKTLPQKDQSSDVFVRPKSPQQIPVWRRRPPVDHDRMGISTDKLKYSFEPAGKELFIENQGLCQTYGVFGVPGCGKTYLLRHLLGNIAAHESSDADKKFGILILDPKGSLLSDVEEIVDTCGRSDDLVVINENRMRGSEDLAVNVIDSYLEPVNLGKALSMAAQSAGISSKEPYWMNELGTIFGASAEILDLLSRHYETRPTLFRLADTLLGVIRDDSGNSKTKLHCRISDLDIFRDEMTELEYNRFTIARDTLERFDSSRDHRTLRSFVDQSYGVFRRPEFKMFSAEVSPVSTESNLYDSIIDDGKILLVSISKRNLALSKIICTLIKTLFQQTVLTRRERVLSGELENFVRPLLFMADEYSDVATELEGQPMGDGLFFSQMRQFGCMGLVATQSVHMLKNSALGDTWKGIFANMAAKIFMQLGDTETAEEASKLVGESEYRFQTFDRSYSKDGSSQSVRFDLKNKKDLPTRVVLQTLGRGQAVVVGAIDGESRPSCRFIHVDGKELAQ